jgi:predicted transcriptional regulator
MRPKVFTLRLRIESRTLLDRAALDQRRSRASIIEECIRQALTQRYSDTQERLNQMLGTR